MSISEARRHSIAVQAVSGVFDVSEWHVKMAVFDPDRIGASNDALRIAYQVAKCALDIAEIPGGDAYERGYVDGAAAVLEERPRPSL